MNPYYALPLATAPYYRGARVTLARRQTAYRMRHCCARRIVETGGRRKSGCTSTRGRAAADDRSRGKSYSNTKRGNAAHEALSLRRHQSCSSLRLPIQGLSLGVPKGGFSFAKENPPFDPCRACGAAMPPRAKRARLNPSKPVWRPNLQKSEELPLRFFCTARIVKVLTMSIQQLSRGASKRRRSSRQEEYWAERYRQA